MADTKISGLPASTTPLAGTEVLPIVQSGSTVKVAVSDLTAGRAVSALSLTSTNGASIQGLTVGLGGGAVSNNTAVGTSALAANTTGASNTAIGNSALNANLSAQQNVAVGNAAMLLNTLGDQNVAVGVQALRANTASSNTAIGSQAALTNTSGGNNVAVGFSALYTNLTSGNSTAVGYQAGKLATGAGNQFFGYNSGSAVTTGAKNVILGSYTGSAAPISTTGSNNIVLSDGDGNVRQVIDSSGNVGIGVTPSAWSDAKVVQVSNYAAVSSSGAYGGAYSSNCYYNGTNWIYITTDSATRYMQVSGQHQWLTAASGTAATTVTFTQPMTLNASGNLGIGTTSPNASAILDAQSTTKGVRMPNMTTTQKNAIASPAAGLMVFDTTLAKLAVYSGTAWQTITSV